MVLSSASVSALLSACGCPVQLPSSLSALCVPPSFLHRFFVDLRWISCLMCGWLGIVLLIMTEIGIFSNPAFVAFGPRPSLTFMHVSIDTPYKYGMLVTMIILHTLVSDFISDSLTPHVINTLQVPPHPPPPQPYYYYYYNFLAFLLSIMRRT